MKFYNISDKGELIQINKLEFKESDVYLVEDEEKKIDYIWVGHSVSEMKKKIIGDVARKIEKEQTGQARIQIMNQNREYGSFLAMMTDLQKGLRPGISVERRPEFLIEQPIKRTTSIRAEISSTLKQPSIEYNLIKWLEQLKKYRKADREIKEEEPKEFEEEAEIDLESQIREVAYFLSLANYSYNDLCWFLAEKIISIQRGMPSLEDIRKKAEEVFRSSSTYDELCWLNAQVDILIKGKFLKKEKVTFK